MSIAKLIILSKKEGNSKKPVYQMHKWWARRLGVNFRFLLIGATSNIRTHEETIWSRFYKPNTKLNLTILDPFMGGGTSIVEATKLGARTVGVDLDPLAWFIVSKQISNFNESEFQADWKFVQKDLADQISAYYKTWVNGKSADIINCFWVEIIPCESCGHEFEGHIHYLIYSKKKKGEGLDSRGLAFCKNCHELHELQSGEQIIHCKCGVQTDVYNGNIHLGKYICPKCNHEAHIKDISSQKLPLKHLLFAIEYIDPDNGGRGYKKADEIDKELYNEACEDLDSNWNDLPIPDQIIPIEGRSDPRPVSLGYKKYNELFNRRQLLCLALIFRKILKVENITNRELLLLAFSDSLACNNLFCSYAFGYQKLTPLFGLHAFRRISRPVEGNVWGTTLGRGSFSSSVEKVLRGKRYGTKPFEFFYKTATADPIRIKADMSAQAILVSDVKNILNAEGQISHLTIGNSQDLSWIPKRSVDIVLTDPPYYDNLAYSEMADFYFVWLRDYVNWAVKQTSMHTPICDSLFVRGGSEEEHKRYTEGLTSAFSGCRKAIKDDGLMIFTYHHAKGKAWESLTSALRCADFRVTNCFPLLAEGKSGFHSSDGNIKWDIVFICRPGAKLNQPKFKFGHARRWLDTHMTKWETEAYSGGASFSESDKRSLSFGLLTAYLTNRTVTDEDIRVILKHYEERL